MRTSPLPESISSCSCHVGRRKKKKEWMAQIRHFSNLAAHGAEFLMKGLSEQKRFEFVPSDPGEWEGVKKKLLIDLIVSGKGKASEFAYGLKRMEMMELSFLLQLQQM
ncbi:hypothetical protein CDAR_559781 [Caerostris darwini]|uniref:Uncharacterized protein n=1 Tax=Caerostris darwini TaxID=1538125 RepID=A0AAV4SG08_9ARAC|nr:hypothetical protein CDAR_559781 [Caerostris darwini]